MTEKYEDLVDRIATVIAGEEDYPHPRGYKAHAQAIIDEFGMTVRGDDCGYHEIYGSYDTRFGKWEQQ